MFVEESPEVRFDDIMVVEISDKDMLFDIDPRFLEVCHPGSVLVSGCVPDVPCMPGAVVEGGQVRVRTLRVGGFDVVKLTLRLTGIRKGFLGHRFPDRSQRQFEANEKFINSAYPAE